MGLLDIDLNRLEEEWCNQPKLYAYWAKKYAKACQDCDDAKTELSILEADLTIKIKCDPVRYGLPEGAAAGQISAMVTRNEKWKTKSLRINMLQYRKKVIGSTVSALEQRKSALERLVQLHGQEYFSKPVARTPEAKEAVDKIKARTARKKTQRTTQRTRREIYGNQKNQTT
jgi:hypothetical protein